MWTTTPRPRLIHQLTLTLFASLIFLLVSASWANAQITRQGSLTAQDYHTCAVKHDGTVACWGTNRFGQLGFGTLGSVHLTPVTVPNLVGVTAVASGLFHTCALKSDGTVACWGSNPDGQLGDGTTDQQLVPVAVTGLTGVTAIVAGTVHTCALKANGTVACWGNNQNGQLGDGTFLEDRHVPTIVSGLSDVVAITAGDHHTCAVKTDGSAWCWGLNTRGQLGNGSLEQRLVPTRVTDLSGAVAIAAGQAHTCAVKSDGTAMCWGTNYNGQLGSGSSTNVQSTPVAVAGLTEAITITAGSNHTCVIKFDQTIACWGINYYGQLGDGTLIERTTFVPVPGLSGAIAMAASSFHTCALKTGGTIACWGDNVDGLLGNGTPIRRLTPVATIGLHEASGVTAGSYHTCASKTDGTAACWGINEQGQLGNGTINHGQPLPDPVSGLSDIATLSTYSSHTCSSQADGTATCWGWNIYGQLGDGTSGASNIRTEPHQVTGLTDARTISTGAAHTCALKTDDTVMCWGYNYNGQLGDGSMTNRLSPVPVPYLSQVTAMALGSSHTCALKTDGTVMCWGGNWSGQIGDGTSVFNRLYPTAVLGLSDVIAISAGFEHTCALKTDGTVACWGYNENGQLGDGTTSTRLTPVPVVGLTNVIALGAGSTHTCAIKADGTATCWGSNEEGQLGNGSFGLNQTTPIAVSGLTRATSIAAGVFHTCALKDDRTVTCWGYNHFGQLGNGEAGHSTIPKQVVGDSFGLDTFFNLSYAAGTNGTLQGATSQSVISGGDGSPVTAIPNPGYHFSNWSDGLADNPRQDTYVQADLSVSAGFAPNSYTLSFNSHGGSPVNPIVADYGSVIPWTSAPTLNNHVFVRWNTQEDDTGMAWTPGESFLVPAHDVTFHAIWENSLTVTLTASPNPARTNESIVMQINATDAFSAPLDGRIDVFADTGESCSSNAADTIDPHVASFTCSLQFDTLGPRNITAQFSGSATHMDTLSDAVELKVMRIADLSITADDGKIQASEGDDLEYLVEVRNSGPDEAPNSEVLVLVEPQLIDQHWTCTPVGSANCPASNGNGPIDATVSLPAGSGLDYLFKGQIDGMPLEVVLDALVTATKDAPQYVHDPVSANNQAQDRDKVALVFSDGLEGP